MMHQSNTVPEKYVSRSNSTTTITNLLMITLFTVLMFSSCSLEQQAGHTQSFRMPIFSSYASIPRAIYMDQQTNNEKQYFLSLPPVVGWETAIFSAEQDTIDFDFLDTTVTCTVDVQEDRVVFSGANESVDLNFTVFDDDRFIYTGIILTERNNGPEVNYWTIFESTLEGEITDNFISSTTGIAKAWEVTPQGSFNESEPAEDTGTLIYLTYAVGEQEGISYFTALTSDETAKDTAYYQDPSTLTIDAWETKEALFDTVFDTQSLTAAGFTLHLNDGLWVPAD